eukprot:TRINITY_DN6824_c1_g2_i6.p1 TRINITY_DN6824_c1_g2~~TRINITY_DN6824_c1_g2_i6.p1  ORF type:complete len:109 (-),score=26.50 TRINITY_DN6824_c1_g2_i6:14-340(-)
MALARVPGGVTLALTGFIEERDSDLLAHLASAHAALCFGSGGFDFLQALIGDRDQYLERVRRVTLELVPLVSLPWFVLGGTATATATDTATARDTARDTATASVVECD